MFSQGRRPSDFGSVSSVTSDVTSRATTLSNSPSDITYHTQQKIDHVSNQSGEANRLSTPTNTTVSAITVISKKSNEQSIYNNLSNRVTTGNQQQPWVNPYWDPKEKSGTAVVQSGTNNANSPSSARVQQLIPGSILINDQGEIDDLSWKQNKRLNSNISNNLFNSDNNNGPSGYLTPTHIQRHIVTSSPGLSAHPENQFGYKRSSSSSDAVIDIRPTFTRQQTFPQSTDNNIQPWVNPYWSKSNQINSPFKPIDDTNQTENAAPPTKSTSSNGTWKNPYWKDWKPQTSTASKSEDKEWKNTSDQSPNDSTLNESLSFEYKVPPIPFFYERIYPPYTPSSSPVPTTDTKHQAGFSTATPKQNINDDENLLFTIDSQGTAHYRTLTPSLNDTNKKVQFVSSSKSSQYPLSPPDLSNAAPPLQTSYTVSTPKSANTASPSSYPTTLLSNSVNYSLSSTSSAIILTEEDLNSIQHALQSFATNSSSITVIETPNEIPSSSSNISHPKNHSSLLFTDNRDQQSHQQSTVPSSNTSHPNNHSSLLFTSNRDQQSHQQSTVPSSNITYPNNDSSLLFTSNRDQQSHQQSTVPSSNITYSNNDSSFLTSLFTGNRDQQPQQQGSVPSSNITYSNNHSSPLASLFSGNQEQEFYQEESAPADYPSYFYDPNTQQLTVFVGSSYSPSRLITQRPVVLI